MATVDEQPQQARTRQLGRGGPQVTAIGWGAMGLSGVYGKPKPDEDRFAMLDHLYRTGEWFWDSSDAYFDSEDLIGRWLVCNPGARDNIFLATKFGAIRDPKTNARSIRNDPKYIHEACEKSLSRLGVDYIDLYYCHRIASEQPIEITVQAMKELQDQGKIRHLGLSEVSAETLRRACQITHISAIQMEYSPFALEVETTGLLKACRELGVAVVAYSPLGRGFLTGNLKSRDDFEPDDFRLKAPRFSEENFDKNLELCVQLQGFADQKGCSVSQLVLAFLLKSGDDIFPIPGTTKPNRLDENMGALNVMLSDVDEQKIRQAIAAVEVQGSRYPEQSALGLFADTISLEKYHIDLENHSENVSKRS